jgi:hypothetical protein
MEDIYWKVGSIALGLIIVKILLSRLNSPVKKKEDSLVTEYIDILNNPEYKVKGKST